MNEVLTSLFSPDQWRALGWIYAVVMGIAAIAGFIRWLLDRRF